MDIDEEEYREGRLSARLFGYLRVPHARQRLQSQKARTPAHEIHDQQAVAAGIAGLMRDDILYIVGPGTTTRVVLEGMGLRGTLLGVDVVLNGELVAQDVNEHVRHVAHDAGREGQGEQRQRAVFGFPAPPTPT